MVYHDDTHHPVSVVMYSFHSYAKMGDVKILLDQDTRRKLVKEERYSLHFLNSDMYASVSDLEM